MTVFFGGRRRFAAEVGDWSGPAVRRVDLWAVDQWLTRDDSMAFVPQFRIAVADSADRLRAGHGSAQPFAGLSAVATHRRLVAGSGQEEHDDLLRRPSNAMRRQPPLGDAGSRSQIRMGATSMLSWYIRSRLSRMATARCWRSLLKQRSTVLRAL
jgi:hypothetical protein